MTKCKNCNTYKSDDLFYKATKYKEKIYFSKVCIECTKEKRNKYHKNNKEKENIRSSNYSRNNKEKVYKKQTETRNKNEKKSLERYGLGLNTIYFYGLETSLIVYDRANRKCEECGRDSNLVIHHRDHKGILMRRLKIGEMNNDIDNLVVLCSSCHGRLHAKERWAQIKKENLNKTTF